MSRGSRSGAWSGVSRRSTKRIGDIHCEPGQYLHSFFRSDGLFLGLVDDDAGKFHVPRLQHAYRSQGMTQRAKIAAGDQQRRYFERRNPVKHSMAPVQGHHDSPNPFDQCDICPGVGTAPGDQVIEWYATILALGRHVGGERAP